MNLSTEKQMIIEIVDMLTDWFQEQSNDICSQCSMNRSERDIGYSTCPADFSLADCPNFMYDLEHELTDIAQRLIDILPEPEDEY